MTSHRLAAGGRIDRGHTVRFTFDGKTYAGYDGDTLASAMLANGVRLLGRSFKYHRPRGLLAAGYEEPNALVTVTTDGARTPNIRATELEIHDGLVVESQNRKPSLALDLMEEFRHIAERLTLTLINRAQINARDFVVREGGAVLLEGDARKAVVIAYQERKQEEITHSLLAQPVALGLIPLIQARLLARTLREETREYPPYLTR